MSHAHPGRHTPHRLQKHTHSMAAEAQYRLLQEGLVSVVHISISKMNELINIILDFLYYFLEVIQQTL